MKTIKVDYIPDGFRRTNIKDLILIKNDINVEEGNFIVGEVQNFEYKKINNNIPIRNHIYINGKEKFVKNGNIIPLILSYRNSLMEFSGVLPKKIIVGDILHILGGDGYAGKIIYNYPYYGLSIEIKVLGSIVNEKGKQLSLNDFSIPQIINNEKFNIFNDIKNGYPFVLAIIGTRMDVGKTTTGFKIVNNFLKEGKKVISGKLTGFGCRNEVEKLGTNFGYIP